MGEVWQWTALWDVAPCNFVEVDREVRTASIIRAMGQRTCWHHRPWCDLSNFSGSVYQQLLWPPLWQRVSILTSHAGCLVRRINATDRQDRRGGAHNVFLLTLEREECLETWISKRRRNTRAWGCSILGLHPVYEIARFMNRPHFCLLASTVAYHRK
jgi:hypothetical protein